MSLLENTFQSFAQIDCSKIYQHSGTATTFRMMDEKFRKCFFFHHITQPGLQSPGTVSCPHKESKHEDIVT